MTLGIRHCEISGGSPASRQTCGTEFIRERSDAVYQTNRVACFPNEFGPTGDRILSVGANLFAIRAEGPSIDRSLDPPVTRRFHQRFAKPKLIQ